VRIDAITTRANRRTEAGRTKPGKCHRRGPWADPRATSAAGAGVVPDANGPSGMYKALNRLDSARRVIHMSIARPPLLEEQIRKIGCHHVHVWVAHLPGEPRVYVDRSLRDALQHELTEFSRQPCHQGTDRNVPANEALVPGSNDHRGDEVIHLKPYRLPLLDCFDRDTRELGLRLGDRFRRG